MDSATPPPVWRLSLILSILFGLIATISWVAWFSPPVSTNQPWSSRETTLVTTGVTLLSTFFFDFVTKTLEKPIVQSVDALFQRHNKRRKITKFILLSLIIGQLAGSMVGILTPNIVTRTNEYNLTIPGAGYLALGNNTESFPCAGMVELDVSSIDRRLPAYKWPFGNGTFMARYTGGDCPPSRTFPLVASINPGNRSRYAYVDSGIAVHPSAMGASKAIFSGGEFMQLIETYGRWLSSTKQCVPVMVRNPVTCTRQGSLKTEGEHFVNFTLGAVEPGGQEFYRNASFHYRNLGTDSVMLNYLFSGTQDTIDTVGRGIMGFRAVTLRPSLRKTQTSQ